MYNTSFIKKTLLAATVVLFCSCDKDFNAIGDDLIGDDHFGLDSTYYDVIAYNQEVTPVQSNLLPINALGVYDSPVFGETTANFTTQLALATYAPTIGEEPEIESVKLSIPYFSRKQSTDSEGNSTYKLDSIYGPKDGKIKLSIYESKYQMRTSYPSNGTQLPQYYYTDESSVFAQNFGVLLNDSADKLQNEEFFFSSREYKDEVDNSGTKTTTYVAPEMRLNLNEEFFQDKILKAAASKLSTADVFQEYFRGLYFKAEKSGSNAGNLALLDFSKGKITITYKAKTAITTDPETTKEEKTIVINLISPTSSGGTANLLADVKNSAYQNAIQAPNRTTGDERLYVRGGEGSAAVIELKDFASKMEEIRTGQWKVNEANLVFHIDAEAMSKKLTDGADMKEPTRVYLYDLDNNTPLLDFSADGSSSVTSDARLSKLIFGGIINLDATTKRGSSYKIRITNHIRNLIKTDAKNVRLGLVVTDNISITTSNQLKNRFPFPGTNPVEYFSAVPRVSVMNPLGTILYGGTASVPVANRLRLEVYYTKPNK